MPLFMPNPISRARWEPVVDAAGNEHPRLILVDWDVSATGEYLVQIYLDGYLYDVSPSPDHRSICLGVDRQEDHQIELIAVCPSEPWANHHAQMTEWGRLGSIPRVVLHRSVDVALDARVRLSLDATVQGETPVWTSREARPGFGGMFGSSDFGFEFPVGPGLGRAWFGSGPLGCDSDPIVWPIGRSDASRNVMIEVLNAEGDPVKSGSMNIGPTWRLPNPPISELHGFNTAV